MIVREKAALTASGVAEPDGQALEPRQPSSGVVSTSNIGKKIAVERLLLQRLEQFVDVSDCDLGRETGIDCGETRCC